MNVVPRDFVVDAIAELSTREETIGKVYQLCNPHPPTISGLARALAGTGIRCPLFEGYVDRLVAYVRQHPEIDDTAMV